MKQFVIALFSVKGAANDNPMFIRKDHKVLDTTGDLGKARVYYPIDDQEAVFDMADVIKGWHHESKGFGPESYPCILPVFVEVNDAGKIVDKDHFEKCRKEIRKSLEWVRVTHLPVPVASV